MLVGIVMVICIVLWAAIQKNLTDQGHEPLSRGQLSYMRKKARKQGVDVSQISYKPRKGTNPFGGSSAGKIVRDFSKNPYGKAPRKSKGS
jgi:hypothetical protein